MNDLLIFALNGGGWALKPILEKISVDKLGHYYFSFFHFLCSCFPWLSVINHIFSTNLLLHFLLVIC